MTCSCNDSTTEPRSKTGVLKTNSVQVWKASKWEEVDLYPLRSLTPGQLTSVSLNNKQQLPATVDLRWIPASVRELNMKGFTVRPNHPRALEGLRLHSLDCRNGEMPPTETWRLLQCLPGLKVQVSPMCQFQRSQGTLLQEIFTPGVVPRCLC